MKVGVMVRMCQETDVKAKFGETLSMGFDNCQLVCWDRKALQKEKEEEVKQAVKETGMEITAFWCGWDGPQAWDFLDGPITLGFIPAEYRFQRLQQLLCGCDFAKNIGVKDVVTHAGFLPENPYDQRYHEVLAVLKVIVAKCKENGQNFLFETGQETPVTLLRTIEDLGGANCGINLDPANLVLYGKANPNDAMEVFGKYVMGVHGKDGKYPTNGMHLGAEVPLGQGKVDFPKLIAQLREAGYDGAITIEREISGPQQIEDIKMAKAYLETLLAR